MKKIILILSILFISGCNEAQEAFWSKMDMLEGVNIALKCHEKGKLKSDFNDCVEILIAKELILKYGHNETSPDVQQQTGEE